jgi:cysteine desulfurase
VNAARAPRLAGTSSIAFAQAPADALLIGLDLEGIAASAGSACAAGSLEPSHVLAAIGVSPADARGVLRFSLGRTTREAEIERVVSVIPEVVAQVRGVAV